MQKKSTAAFMLPMLLLACCLQPADPKESLLWKRAAELHQEAIVIDTHCDTPMWFDGDRFDIGFRNELLNVDLAKMKEGGVTACVFAAFIPSQLPSDQAGPKARQLIAAIHRQIGKYPDLAAIAYRPADIRRMHQARKKAILIGIENGSALQGNLSQLRDYYDLGVRVMTLTHNANNDIADSSGAEKPSWNGLSPFGRMVVAEMNRLGMVVDVSHLSDRAFWDVLNTSRAPVMASHSSLRALCPASRNLSDDMLKGLAKQGGIIQINFYSGFLDPGFNSQVQTIQQTHSQELNQLHQQFRLDPLGYYKAVLGFWKKHSPPPPPIEVLIDHIERAVRLAGVDHVGLGSDFDGASSFPRGLETIDRLPLITYHLLKRGYRPESIKKILGGNFLCLFDRVSRIADRTH